MKPSEDIYSELLTCIKLHGDVVAMLEPHSGKSWTYCDLAGIISALCNKWTIDELPQTVVIHGDMSIDTAAVFLATQVSGRTAVMLDADNLSELGRKISLAMPQAVLQPSSLISQLAWEATDEIPPRGYSDPRDVGSAFLTSGSTGEPKLFGTPFEDYANSTRATPPEGVTYSMLNTRRPSTISHRGNVRRAIRGGGTFISVDLSTLSPSHVNALLADLAVIELGFTSAMLRQLIPHLDSKWTQSVVGIRLAGDRVLASDFAQIAEKMPWVELRTPYGLTEFGTVTERFYGSEEIASFIGQPTSGKPVELLTIRIINDEGVVVPNGETGNIEIRGFVNGFPGIFTEDGHLEFGQFPNDEWMLTGDKGFLNDVEELTVLGRWQETVNIKGSRVSLVDIERELVSTGLAVEALAAVYKDAQGNDAIGSLIVPLPGKDPTLANIRLDMTSRVSLSMVPTRLVVVDEIPLFPNGKQNRIHAAQLLQDVQHQQIQHVLTQTEKVIRDIVLAVLEIEVIAGDSDLFSLGADSLSCLQILADLESAFGKLLDIRVLVENPTISMLAEAIENGHRPTGRLVPLGKPTEIVTAPLVYWILPGANPFMAVKIASTLPGFTHQALLNLGALPGDVGGDDFDSMVDCLRTALENNLDGRPFVVAGFSSASYLANELVNKLEETSNTPMAMVILDPPIHEDPSKEFPGHQTLADPFYLMLAREGRLSSLDPVRADHALFGLQLSALHRHVPRKVSVPVLLVGNRLNVEHSGLLGTNPSNAVVVMEQPHMEFLRNPIQVAQAIENFIAGIPSVS